MKWANVWFGWANQLTICLTVRGINEISNNLYNKDLGFEMTFSYYDDAGEAVKAAQPSGKVTR